ncbi:basic helix-loop-helix (bHLH) DNA-binding superfamily protein [Euphorbia peplus]|nr:basic helix-loop-helix (bHLH) DNA-binding superfamily protein [Euphorbia peplus]
MEINNNTRSDRKEIERNRRNQMKSLFSTLNSLIHHSTSKEPVSLPDQLNDAIKYIKKLQMKLERMKEKKEWLLVGSDHHDHHNRPNTIRMCGLRSPVIKVHEVGSALQVVLITGLDSQITFNEVVHVLHQERVEIVNASFSILDDTIFHSIHSTVGDCAPGYVAARISERLNKFVEDSM